MPELHSRIKMGIPGLLTTAWVTYPDWTYTLPPDLHTTRTKLIDLLLSQSQTRGRASSD